MSSTSKTQNSDSENKSSNETKKKVRIVLTKSDGKSSRNAIATTSRSTSWHQIQTVIAQVCSGKQIG